MKLSITPDDLKTDLKAVGRFFYIFIVSLTIFLVFSLLYGVENVIKITYILTKPNLLDVVSIYFFSNLIAILPFVTIFSLAYFAYKLDYRSLSDIVRLSVILGVFIYILFFVAILLTPRVDALVLSAYKNFSTSPSTPKNLLTKSKIHFVGNEKVVPIVIRKNSFDAVVVRKGKTQIYHNLRIVPYDNGIRIKSGKTQILDIPYEKVIPPSFGKLYEKIYRGFMKIATQFPLTRYVEKFSFTSFLNLLLYVEALTIGMVYVIWLFRDYPTTKILILSLIVAVLGVTVMGFLGSVFEFMKFSSLLEGIKDIISGLMAITLAILVVMGAYKMDQILKGRVGG
ncbi:MAG: hypothetical protein ABDH28_06790 [Brevinematia bacterium]